MPEKAYDELKAVYPPNNTMVIMTLKNEFANSAPKNGKTDPDEWFNELDTYKARLGIMGSDIPDADMIAHLMRKISSKEYDPVVAHMMTTMRANPAQVTVANLKRAIRDRYKMMKLSGAIKKELDEAFFTKKFKGTCNNVASKVTRVPIAGARKALKARKELEPISACASSARRQDTSRRTVLSLSLIHISEPTRPY